MPAPGSQMSQSVPVVVVAAVSQGAGALLSAAVDLLEYDGVVEVVQSLGTITGSISIPVLTQSDTSGGTYVALATEGAFGVTASALTKVQFSSSEAKLFIKYSTTVTTGPAAMSVVLSGFKKYR